MQFSAVLSNPAHPECGVAKLYFPLSRGEYDYAINALSALEIGHAVRQDCKVDELTDCYPVLNRLEGQTVNVDELDYLAKRLDSFCAGEDVQFQAMAEKLDLTNIRDFINLTFCCQQVTVITDFSRLEEVGRSHYMTLHDGCASTEELENLNGKETAYLLIDSGAGVVTPYGVVYDNGMELAPQYHGGAFPPYLHDIHPLVLEVSPLSEPEDTENVTFLCLPMTEKQIKRALTRGGIESIDQMRLKPDFLMPELNRIPSLKHESLNTLNEMCVSIIPFVQNDQVKLDAAISLARPQSASQIKRLAKNLELFDFIPKVKTPAEYGRYMIEESGHFEYDSNLEDFYDFEGYAKQRISQEDGQFVKEGYISYQGVLSLDELMMEDPAEQDQKEQGFQMDEIQ